MFNDKLGFTNGNYIDVTLSSKHIGQIKDETAKTRIIKWDIVKTPKHTKEVVTIVNYV